MIGLKFLLNFGAFLQTLITKDLADKIIKDHINGTLPAVIGGTNPEGSWSVRVSDIQGIHTFPIEEQGIPKGRSIVQPAIGNPFVGRS